MQKPASQGQQEVEQFTIFAYFVLIFVDKHCTSILKSNLACLKLYTGRERLIRTRLIQSST